MPMHRIRKLLIWFGAVFVAVTVFAFFGLPPLMRSYLIRTLSDTLHREVTIQQIRINPLTLSLTVRGVMVKERGTPETFASFDQLFINLQSFSVFRWALILKEVRLDRPYIRIVRHQDGSYNFSDLLAGGGSGQGGGAAPSRFSFNNIRIVDGSMDLLDQPKQTSHTVRDMNIAIPFISNYPYYIETSVEPRISATINGSQYVLEGKTKPFASSRQTAFDIEITDLDIPHYLAYLPLKTNFAIRSGKLTVKAQLSFVQHPQPALTVEGHVALRQLSVSDAQDRLLLTLPLLDLSLAPTEPLAGLFHAASVTLESPELFIRRDRAGMTNLQTLFPRNADTPTDAKAQDNSTPIIIDIDGIRLIKGMLSFSDAATAIPFTTVLNPVELRVEHFSTRGRTPATFALQVKTEVGEEVALNGDLSLDPLTVKGQASLQSIALKKYSPYYADRLLFDVQAGTLGLSTQYVYKSGDTADAGVNLSDLSVSIASLKLKKRDETEAFAVIPFIGVKKTRLDQPTRELVIGEFSTTKGSLALRRNPEGQFNIQTLFTPSPAQNSATTQPNITSTERPWLVTVEKVMAEKYAIKLEDQSPVEPASLVAEDISLRANALTTRKGRQGTTAVSFRLNKGGTIMVKGPVGITPLSARLTVSLKDIDLRPLQPYFTDRVKIHVTQGAVSTEGYLSVTHQDGTGLQAVYKGDVSLTQFGSVDKAHAQDFLAWQSLAFGDLNVGYNPTYVHIGKVALTDFYARLIVYPDGSVNLAQIMEKGTREAKPSLPNTSPTTPQPAPAQVSGKTGADVQIQTVTLQGGRINFSDTSLKPAYSMDLTEIGGRVSGLSSGETTLADVELRGKVNQFAPLEIVGKINPLREDLFVDLKARFKDMDLSSMTPYSGKYIGYTIEKGKLSFDVNYQIAKRRLDAKNNLFLDQMTLGEKVESPTATNLPVRLAIALLKDRKGEIHLDLPVTGSLDDPEFSVWKVVIKILINLISKAATAPFTLLGALLGGGEELGYLEYEPGSAAVADANVKKIEMLIKALYERPSLKLEIEGHVDLEKDKEGLRQHQFMGKLKVQKFNQRLKQGQPSIPVDELNIESAEYERYLTLAYKAETFPKPRNLLGFAKDLPVPEMEKLILTHIQIKDDDLRLLASQRALKVKDAILRSNKVEPERLFIVEPKSLAPEKRNALKQSRVDFRIR
ncbi:MAG: DUF748 domain-containing protein [candidate division NC10 bacterium]|nr:DUF748 domain-containing protein [candidate division NC10 bacterium]MDE2320764.1 DUF748 domain-containing protein [candidate division NC10 bacterium]